ncbi:MAG: MFS transporter [Anaerolineales bacterium]
MQRKQLAIGYAGYALVGVGASLVPALMPSIAGEFAALGLTAMGLLTPASSAGRIIGTLLAGVGSDALGRQRLVWLSALLLSVAMALAAGAHLWAVFLLGYVVIGLVQGALSTSINAMISDAAQEARARALNLLHGVYGAGAAVSPLLIGALVTAGLPWRTLLAGTGALWLAYGLVCALADRRHGNDALASVAPERESKPPRQAASNLAVVRQGPVLALLAIAFIYNGVATSMLTWVAIFTQDSAGLSTFGAVSLVAVFYVALTVGRFVCAALAERLGYGRLLLVLGAALLVTYPPVVLGRHALAVILGVFGTGLALSGLFPTALAEGARRFPVQTGAVTSALTVSLTLGSLVPPLWTGALADVTSLQVALGVNYVLALALVPLARYLRRSEAQPAPGA